MSYKELAKNMIDRLPESQMIFVINMLEGLGELSGANVHPEFTPNAETLEAVSYQNGMLDAPNWCDGTHQNDPTNTIDYTKSTKKSIKGFKGVEPKQFHTAATTPFNPSILEKQIMKSCMAHGVQDFHPFTDIIKYYYDVYERTFGKEHPRLSAGAMDSVISSFLSSSDNLDGLEYDPEAYHAMIDRHFQTQYQNCDYNICHFMTEEVRNNRFYETCY